MDEKLIKNIVTTICSELVFVLRQADEKKRINDYDRNSLFLELSVKNFQLPDNVVLKNVSVEQMIENWPTELRKALIMSSTAHSVCITRLSWDIYNVCVQANINDSNP